MLDISKPVTRPTLAALVQAIKSYDALEQMHIAATLAWIDSGALLFRIAKPDVPPQHLVSYCVLVDPIRRAVLLGEHRNASLWLPSGGHVEPDEHPQTTALREVAEELGSTPRLLWDDPLFVTVTQTIGANGGHTDVSLWYVLRGDVDQPLTFDPAEFHAIRWFPFDAIPRERVDPHMARFTAKLQQALDHVG